MATLLDLLGAKKLTAELWNAALDEAVRIQEYIRDQVYLSRKKDYDDPFRQTTFRNAAGDEGRRRHGRGQQLRQTGPQRYRGFQRTHRDYPPAGLSWFAKAKFDVGGGAG